MQDNKTFSKFPLVRNIKYTPHVPGSYTKLEYTPELIKAAYARVFYRKMSYGAISIDLKITPEQAKKAHHRGRLRGVVSEYWATYVPELKYKDVESNPKVVKVKVKQPPKPPKYSDELILWAMAQYTFKNRTAYDIARFFERLVLEKKLDWSPGPSAVYQWSQGRTKQSTRLLSTVTAKHADLYTLIVEENPPRKQSLAEKNTYELQETINNSIRSTKGEAVRLAEARVSFMKAQLELAEIEARIARLNQ